MSFVEYSADCDFPIQNLPYGVFSTAGNVSRVLLYGFYKLPSSVYFFLCVCVCVCVYRTVIVSV